MSSFTRASRAILHAHHTQSGFSIFTSLQYFAPHCGEPLANLFFLLDLGVRKVRKA